VIIVGAGITGLSAALHLKQLGTERVVVLERGHAGTGQSGRAAGIVRALVNNTAVSAMLMESLRFFGSFAECFGEPLPVRQAGYLLVEDAARQQTMETVLRNAAASGCDARRIPRGEALELQPGLRERDDDIYAFEPSAICVEPMLATQILKRVVQRMGVTVEHGCEVTGLSLAGSRIMGVETARGRITGNQVLLATSVLGAAQLQPLGIQVPVYPRRTEMAFFSVFPDSPYRLARIVSDARTLLYLRPEGSEQMFVGWREGDRRWSPEDSAGLNPDDYWQSARYESLAEMERRLAGLLPFAADGFVSRTYACVYDYTPDGMPILDRAETLDGLYFALGFSGGGFSLSPWVGSVMAKLMATGEKPPGLDLLRRSRFETGDLLSWSNTAEVRA
jgi:glycine/D-amino acid oxidase-like deaminating enzyme